MKKRSDYFQRQIYILSNLGLFYIIIIALFAIPMVGAFVAVFIKGVIDLKYAIIFGSILILGGAVYFLSKLIIRLYRKFRKDGTIASQEFKDLLLQGTPVQISFLDGLVTVSSGKDSQTMKIVPNTPSICSDDNSQSIPLLPSSGESKDSIISQLKELSELKEKSVISEEEFQILKKKIIHEL